MSKYSVAAHAASDRKKWILVTIAILLLIAIVVLIITTNCFTDWNKYCLFGHSYNDKGVCTRCGAEKLDDVQKDDDKKDPDKEASVNGGGVATVLPGNGIRLMAAKLASAEGVPLAVSENTWTLTASVNSEADDKYINWSVRWKDAQASWVTGKTVTDYLTITPTTAGALTATAKVLKDFGAQIEVVATSRDNPEKSAVCVFDYVQKITGITVNVPNLTSGKVTFTYSLETSAYTVESQKTVDVGGTMKLSQTIKDYLDSHAAFQLGYGDADIIDKQANSFSLCASSTVSTYFDSNTATLTGLPGAFVSYDSSDDSWDAGKALSMFRAAVNSCSGAHASFDISFTATYSGRTYSSGSKTIEVKFDGSAIHIPVTDVTLNQSHIYA